ncbi:MAG: glutamate synthase subunit alpha, partial [Gemmatimonadaceae bacterium]
MPRRAFDAAAGVPRAQGLYDPSYERDGCGMGFVAHLRGARSNEVLRHALTMLTNLEHRSAVGGDAGTSDGAGVLLQLPHAFLRTEAASAGIAIPDAGRYGLGMCFLPRNARRARAAVREIDQIVRAHGCRPLGWRDVPIDDKVIGFQARATLPRIRQFFVAPAGLDDDATDGSAFERRLYVVRRAIERQFQTRADSSDAVYVASLSARTIVYKGLVRPSLIARFYRDLASPEIATAIALVHSRFSTNTFPAWARAHPYRMLCHNGEINTLGGNLRWTAVREEQMSSPRLPDMHEVLPLIAPGQSDSASLDNALELLVQAGRSLPHAMLMLIPQAWEGDDTLAP